MKNFLIVIACALCCIFNRTLSAPVIKASGVQWSEPKGTGKGNITLIMIPQNESCGNDTDMIVAVKSDYQILSQDTQLLNLVVNEHVNNKSNVSTNGTYLQKCSSLKEDDINKQELLRHPNDAKYFESENKLPSQNITNNTVNVYPLLLRNYQNLVALNGTSTPTPYNTVDILQLVNMSVSNSKFDNSNDVKIPSDLQLYSVTTEFNSLNLTDKNETSVIPDGVVKNSSDSISQSMIGSDDNFLKEALNILDKLKQDPSYYSKLKTNQIPSTEEIKEQGDISLTDSKTKFLKSDDSALASDEGEGLGREFQYVNQENQDISNIEGNVNVNIHNSTCLPFFLSVNSEQTTQDLNIHSVISLERVPLKGTGSNVSQEFVSHENTPIASFSSNCKLLSPNNTFDISQTTKTPVAIYINTSVGYGIQSNLSQILSVNNCKPSNGLYTESTSVDPLAIATGQTEYGGLAENVTSILKGESLYVQQTLAAPNIAAGSELKVTDSPKNVGVMTGVSVSGNDNYLSKSNQECVTSTVSSDILVPPSIELANKAPSAAEMNSPAIPENQNPNISEPEVPVTKIDQFAQNIVTGAAVSFDGTTPQNVLRPNEGEIKTTECMANALSQTVPPIVVLPISTGNVAAGVNGLSEIQTQCVTNPNIILNQESGLPQAGVGSVPRKITLEPQISCGTLKREESSTISHVEDQESCFKDKDLTLPLVKSSIFLANNNDMPKGKDIPISLNASLDDFSLSDLQEKEDRLHGKVAELYNRNPIVFNVEREPKGKILKPQLKYYKNEMVKKPTIYFDQLYNPDSNKILKMNLAGQNLIFQRKPSYKSENNKKMCNGSLENNNTLMNYEVDEPVGNDNVNVEPQPTTTPQITVISQSNIAGANEQIHLGTAIKPANEEDKLLTILNTLDQTTLEVTSYGELQENVTLLDVSTVPAKDNTITISVPFNEEKVLNSQESGQSNSNFNNSKGQEESENYFDFQLNTPINSATKQPYSFPKLQSKPKGRHPERVCSKHYKTKTNKLKTMPNVSKTSSSEETAQYEEKTLSKDKMSIPADSVQKIVIEIVRNTKKPENKPENCKVKLNYSNEVFGQSMVERKEQMPCEEVRNDKQNFVPFQSAWKPVQTKEEPTVFPLSNAIQQNLVNGNRQVQDVLKTKINEYNDIPEKCLQDQSINGFFENQDTFKQEQNPKLTKEYNKPFHQTATNHEKSAGANLLRLLMADNSVFKNE